MQRHFDPLADLRQALGNQQPCQTHPPLRLTISRGDASDWHGAIQSCPEQRRIEHQTGMLHESELAPTPDTGPEGIHPVAPPEPAANGQQPTEPAQT